jgi:hypothetical protein
MTAFTSNKALNASLPGRGLRYTTCEAARPLAYFFALEGKQWCRIEQVIRPSALSILHARLEGRCHDVVHVRLHNIQP